MTEILTDPTGFGNFVLEELNDDGNGRNFGPVVRKTRRGNA
jgi:hypothetical protein